MEIAIKIASSVQNDVPVGAVIVKDGEIISIASNSKENTHDITAHAEITAIKKAEEFLHNWRLDDCDLYVTLEPCPMCAWAILQSRIKNVYFGSYDNQYGALGSKLNLTLYSNQKVNIKGGILEDKCNKLLNDFFRKVRDDN